MTSPPLDVRPGDMGLIHDRSWGGLGIGVLQFLDDIMQGRWRKAERDSRWRHLFVVESVDVAADVVHVVEAWPGGARRHTYSLSDPDVLWSSGRGGLFDLSGSQRVTVVEWLVAHLKAPYSWAGYLLKAVKDSPLPVPMVERLLERQLVNKGHYQCAWLGAAAYAAAGVGWPRAVWDLDPDDIGAMVEAAPLLPGA
jgi:hypothetical protein